jgi:hypothetical protein
MVGGKFCKDCGELRSVSQFTRDRAGRDGLSFYCRTHAAGVVCCERRTRAKGRPRRDSRGTWWFRTATDGVLTAAPRSRWTSSSSGFGQASGRDPCCKPCHNIRGKAAKDKVGGARTYHLKRRYGITAEEADAMQEEQGGLCATCTSAPAAHVDHGHETSPVRALLCFNCNGGLGQSRTIRPCCTPPPTTCRSTPLAKPWQRNLGPPAGRRTRPAARRSPRRPGRVRGRATAQRTGDTRRPDAAGDVAPERPPPLAAPAEREPQRRSSVDRAG